MPSGKWADRNQAIIEEFRANDGVVGGYFTGVPIALVHHKGARSGRERVTPLASQKLDNGWAVFASKGGADENPGWYYNLLANPEVKVEVGTESFRARADVTREPERSRLYAKMVAQTPWFAEYEKKTTRVIPVVLLTRLS
jgi:deazaflavin-dependent oxidoreductase (nitroreductase family)